MSRKSRKNLPESNPPSNTTYKAAGYIRLSVAKGVGPSAPILNQKRIIEAFESSSEDIILQKFYIDENVSGTTFERKAFQEMLDDIAKGEINCVIIKDLSRLGRDAIETGFYVEQYFPARQVRFISINDQLDTLDGFTNISFKLQPGMEIPIKNLLNEKFAEDIRIKTQASIDLYIQTGKYIAPRAPFGYAKAENDCHLLVPDPKAAAVVRDIFDMALRGDGLNKIVRRLNSNATPAPIDYARENGLQGKYIQGNGLWNTRTVRYILTNRTYAGDLMQGKSQHIVTNTHEPLVSRNVFDAVQKALASSSDTQGKTNVPRSDNTLRGKVICGSCGGKMQRRKGSGKGEWYFFTCISNNRLGKGHCTGMYIRESCVIDAIFTEVGKYIENNAALYATYENSRSQLEAKITELHKDEQCQHDNMRNQYERFVSGVATADELEQVRMESGVVQSTLRDFENQLESLVKSQERHELFRSVHQGKQMSDQLVNTYLKNATVHENKRVEVYFE